SIRGFRTDAGGSALNRNNPATWAGETLLPVAPILTREPLISFILKKQRSGMHLAGKKGQRYSRKHRLARELAEFGKRIHTQGLVAATDGNLSVRLEDGSIMITRTAFRQAAMKP